MIPVYNAPAQLARCLEALARQTYPAAAFEVVVVDNNSDRSLRSAVAGHPNAVLVHESTQGSYAARNRGIRAAQGELLAFTDADCRPHPEWLAQGLEALQQDEEIGLVAGRIELEAERPDAPSPCERYDQLTYLDQQAAVVRGRCGATANLFTSKRIFEAVGYFDEAFVSGGDSDWGRRVSRNGFRLCYCPEALVRHPARRSLGALLGKELRLAGGLAQLERKEQQRRNGSAVDWGWRERIRALGHSTRNVLGVLVGSTGEELPGWPDRVRLAGVMSLMQSARWIEKWRVKLGGEPLNL